MCVKYRLLVCLGLDPAVALWVVGFYALMVTWFNENGCVSRFFIRRLNGLLQGCVRALNNNGSRLTQCGSID